jgi:hypothetical protein
MPRFARPKGAVSSHEEFFTGSKIYTVLGYPGSYGHIVESIVWSIPTQFREDPDFNRTYSDEESPNKDHYVVNTERKLANGDFEVSMDFLRDRNCDPTSTEETRYNDNYFFLKYEDAAAFAETVLRFGEVL